jgi:hypothetical protein
MTESTMTGSTMTRPAIAPLWRTINVLLTCLSRPVLAPHAILFFDARKAGGEVPCCSRGEV